ncbi:MAG: carbon-nitrogen hydrolase family protein [bacterium]
MGATRTFKAALHAASPRLGDVAGNVETVAKAVVQDGAQLVAFPEMFLTGYAIGDDAQRLALRLDDERLEPILKACRKAKAHCVVGGPRTPRPGLTHNSAFLITPGGEVTAYDKRALATFTTFQEGLHFQPGRTSPVWQTELGAIGIGICYDLFFPEFSRRQALAGADILLNISASPTTSQRFFEAILPVRAIENACFSLYSNVVGPQDGVVFWGGAQAHGPRGTMLARSEPLQEGVAHAVIDLDDLAPAREFRPTLRDARLEDIADLP